MKNNEWYTPTKYIEAAREVLGTIDLDPASCELANQIVKATRYYTREQNGLLQPWSGRVWLNPPYARTERMTAHATSFIRLFLDKLFTSYSAGDVTSAIALVTTEVNARWFHSCWQYPICFPDHRIHFIVPEKRPHGDYKQMFGSCFVYLGMNETLFTEVFSRFGYIVKMTKCPPARADNLQLWSA